MNIQQLHEKVENVVVAVVPEENPQPGTLPEWYVYLINLRPEPLEGVIVSSKGYGELEGKEIKTSVLRQFIDKLPEYSFIKLEWIEPKLFGITNEFWVSYYQHGRIFDKQYVFVTDSIIQDNFSEVPLLEKRGVVIR